MQLDKTRWWKLCIISGLMVSLTQCAAPSKRLASPQDLATPQRDVPISQPTLTQQRWPESNSPVAHVSVVTIPPNYPIEIAVSEELKTVEDFATDLAALAVLNGGFFDPNNAQTTSFITVDGSLVADPRHNQRLVDNPDLAVYMDKILNRSEFRRYSCSDRIRYDITVHSAASPDGCKLHSALGAGPQLLPADTSQAEGFTDYANDTLVRDAIGSQQRNARSAIGIKQDGSVVWVMAAQIDAAGGMTLAELSDLMTTLGVQKALNLDGGSSSALYFDQRLVHSLDQDSGRSSDAEPSPHPSHYLRPVKSVLYLSSSHQQ